LHVSAAIRGGASLVHGVQMMNKVNKLEMWAGGWSCEEKSYRSLIPTFVGIFSTQLEYIKSTDD
jgi:hypothetical protein